VKAEGEPSPRRRHLWATSGKTSVMICDRSKRLQIITDVLLDGCRSSEMSFERLFREPSPRSDPSSGKTSLMICDRSKRLQIIRDVLPDGCSSFDIQSIRIPCIRPTVHLICRHSRATVGLYAGETVCSVLYIYIILQFIDRTNHSVPGTLPSVGSKQRQGSLMISNIPNTCSDGCRSSKKSCRCLDRRPICRLTTTR